MNSSSWKIDPALSNKKNLKKKSPLLCQILGINCVVLWSTLVPVKPRLVSAIFGNYFFQRVAKRLPPSIKEAQMNSFRQGPLWICILEFGRKVENNLSNDLAGRHPCLQDFARVRAYLNKWTSILVKAAVFLSTLRVDKSCCVIWDNLMRTVKVLAEFLFAQGKSRSWTQRKENNPLSLKTRQA